MSNSIPAKISNKKETILPDAIEPLNINKTLETIENDLSFSSCLKNLRLQNLNRIILGQMNINSIRNKFDCLVDAIDGNLMFF